MSYRERKSRGDESIWCMYIVYKPGSCRACWQRVHVDSDSVCLNCLCAMRTILQEMTA